METNIKPTSITYCLVLRPIVLMYYYAARIIFYPHLHTVWIEEAARMQVMGGIWRPRRVSRGQKGQG